MVEQDKAKILIVDDEADILEFLRYNLVKEGFRVFEASNGKQALITAKKEIPNLIVLDIMMPEMDGVEVCQTLRNMPEFDNTIIAFLTARNEDYSQIAALEVGGDDYITKPIRPRVFISRIKALLRRTDRSDGSDHDDKGLIHLGNITIDKEKVAVLRDEESIFLAKKEFELLLLLASKPGKVFSRDEIFLKIWGNDVIVGDRTIDVHIRKLREKIGTDIIKTIKGIGYKLEF